MRLVRVLGMTAVAALTAVAFIGAAHGAATVTRHTNGFLPGAFTGLDVDLENIPCTETVLDNGTVFGHCKTQVPSGHEPSETILLIGDQCTFSSSPAIGTADIRITQGGAVIFKCTYRAS